MPLARTRRIALLLEDDPFIECLLKSKRKYGVHPINRYRKAYGEFHHLYKQLRKYPERFFQYLRMSINTFDLLLNKIKTSIGKKITNFGKPICTEERLVVTIRMQQQQLAAQLAHHGSDRRPPLSPAPSDSDSDISLGAHSPVGSPGPLRLGPSSPNPITSFRFGPHSPGPMPAQFRFGNTHTSPNYRLDRQSPTPPNFRLDRASSKLNSESPPMTVDSGSSNYADAINLRLSANESPIDVDSNNDFGSEARDNHSGNSPVRLNRTPPQTTLEHSPPPINLSSLRGPPHPESLKIEAPLALRMTSANQLSTPQVTSPLRVQINSHANRMMAAPSPHTHLLNHHSGIVRIAPQNPQSNGPVLHRPYSPPRLT